MVERSMEHSDVYTVSAAAARFVCCRCQLAVISAQELLPVPFCGRHYLCRACFVQRAGVPYCPGCIASAASSTASVTSVDSRRGLMSTAWSGSRGSTRVNGGHDAATAAPDTDANGNGPPTFGGSVGGVSDVCPVCRRRTDQWFYCQVCTDVESSSRSVCHACWQQHQIDTHLLPRLRLDATSTTPASPSSADRQLLLPTRLQSAAAAAVDDQRLTSASTALRPIRQRPMLSTRDDQPLSSLLGGIAMQVAAETGSVDAATTTSGPGAGLLIAAGLQDPAVRQRFLAALQAPLARQYEGWLWQALNNGGFEQAARSIDERKQQISVNLQSTLRDMEFRLERARGVLDELYRECMRQAVDVSRCQVEALQVQTETLQRVRSAASRLQHARLYNDKARAVAAEADLAHTLRYNASSTCLRPCDDGWSELRSPSDDELRAFLRSACGIDCRVHPAHCTVQSVDRDVNCLSWTLVGRLSEFDVQLRNHCHVAVDDASLTVLVTDSHGAELTYDYQRRSAGHFLVRYRPATTGTHHIYILLRDRHLADSPYTVGVTEPLNYRLTECPAAWNLRPVVSLSYNLVKPWGVCCAPAAGEQSDRFLVADRDAHSVIVFDRNGSFVSRRSSSFRRPTHLAVTSRGEVVVTDKDNHRIQMFSSSCWSHVRTFGSEGDRDGQFRYPWEVAVNSRDEILVSDSKNYRVQLFTSAGMFRAKHCLERASRDDRDGPRGVAFSADDFAAVADFDMLRVLVLSPDLRCVVHVIGVTGLASVPRSATDLRTKGCIERPRGLAFDDDGSLIVVQARTNRETNSLLKFTTAGECLAIQFDKDACGVCVCPDGRIAVVQPQTGVVIYSEM